MPKVIILCGKICSGKSTYVESLKKEINAVVLLCDNLMLILFDEHLGEKHNDILKKCKNYIYDLAQQIIFVNINVILDFGFWFKEESTNIIEFFEFKGIETEIHYIKVDKITWDAQIEKRNVLVKSEKINCYYKERFDRMFEEPDENEDYLLMDIALNNHGKVPSVVISE